MSAGPPRPTPGAPARMPAYVACLALAIVCCADDRGLQPAENVVPLVRRDAVTRHGPRLLAVLNTVSARLTTGSLRALDARAGLRGQDPRLAAESWLRTQGLASTGGASR